MGAGFGLLAAITYGAADFLGGLVSRRTNVFGVVFFSQLVAAAPLVALIPVLGGGGPTVQAWVWGGLAGAAGGAGVTFLYRGLAIGSMTVVAPITAVVAGVASVVFGIATGERPSMIALIGVGAAFVAVILVSSASPDLGSETDVDIETSIEAVSNARPPGLFHALAAGLSFGAFFIFLDGAGDDTGIWPLLATRAASLSVLGVISVASRQAIKPAPGTWPLIAAAGLLDVGANAFYLVATRRGLLSLVAVLTSLYPATTVLLARIVLKERMKSTQLAGLAVAAVAIALIVLG